MDLFQRRDIEQYTDSLAAYLPGGRLFATWFLLNNESIRLLDQGLGDADFNSTVDGFPLEECLTTHKDDPEQAIAFSEHYVRELIQRHGYRIEEPIHFGKWCGRETFVTSQDIIVATGR